MTRIIGLGPIDPEEEYDTPGYGADYHGRTSRYLSRHGGKKPSCPQCGNPMFPSDDHGRFDCLCLMSEKARIKHPLPSPEEKERNLLLLYSTVGLKGLSDSAREEMECILEEDPNFR